MASSILPGGMAGLYIVGGILLVLYIWVWVERPRMAIEITEKVLFGVFYLLYYLALGLWRVFEKVFSWIGRLISGR
jgi:hypothetical protein